MYQYVCVSDDNYAYLFMVFTGVAGDENACTVVHLLWAVCPGWFKDCERTSMP